MAKKYRLKNSAITGKGRVTPFDGKLYDLEATRDTKKTVPATKSRAEYQKDILAPTQAVLKALLDEPKYGKWDRLIEAYESNAANTAGN